jgi:hypothetical protein
MGCCSSKPKDDSEKKKVPNTSDLYLDEVRSQHPKAEDSIWRKVEESRKKNGGK